MLEPIQEINHYDFRLSSLHQLSILNVELFVVFANVVRRSLDISRDLVMPLLEAGMLAIVCAVAGDSDHHHKYGRAVDELSAEAVKDGVLLFGDLLQDGLHVPFQLGRMLVAVGRPDVDEGGLACTLFPLYHYFDELLIVHLDDSGCQGSWNLDS